MASAAQIEANRRNAQKSTGPKTEKGKARSRLNAMTHGLAARTIVPVLPHEDPKELDQRIRSWIEDWQPRDDMEAGLVRQAAELSWRIDRAGRFETAHLAHRVRKAQRRAAGAPDPRRLEQVADLGRKLFYLVGGRTKLKPGPPWDDYPEVFVRRLEASAEGCRWLLDRWAEASFAIHDKTAWTTMARFRFVRLLGMQPIEGVVDPGLNTLLLAWDVLYPDSAKTFWTHTRTNAAIADPGYSDLPLWREIGHRPADQAEAMAVLTTVIEHHVERLRTLLAEHEQLAAEEAAELPDRAAFDPSAGFERHRRYRTGLGRELLRTLETLRKLRKDGFEMTDLGHDSDRVSEEQQADKIGILSLDEQQVDKIGILSHEEEQADEIGVLTQEEQQTDRNEDLPHVEAKPEKAPNEAKLPPPQTDGPEELVSQNGPIAAPERSQLTEGQAPLSSRAGMSGCARSCSGPGASDL